MHFNDFTKEKTIFFSRLDIQSKGMKYKNFFFHDRTLQKIKMKQSVVIHMA